jgi:hypothetical protein
MLPWLPEGRCQCASHWIMSTLAAKRHKGCATHWFTRSQASACTSARWQRWPLKDDRSLARARFPSLSLSLSRSLSLSLSPTLSPSPSLSRAVRTHSPIGGGPRPSPIDASASALPLSLSLRISSVGIPPSWTVSHTFSVSARSRVWGSRN